VRHLLILITVLFFTVNNLYSQIVFVEEPTHNFGRIKEDGGLVSHSFEIKNTGDRPLVITRVSVSCGCTRPKWSKEPIQPSATTEVIVTYDPNGRPGYFNKTMQIHSNAEESRFTLSVRGRVEPKFVPPPIVYNYSVGNLNMHTKTVAFDSIAYNNKGEGLSEVVKVQNDGEVPLTILWGKIPPYLSIAANPKELNSDEAGEIIISIDATNIKSKGRLTATVPFWVKAEGQEPVENKLNVSANIIDDFSKLSQSEKDNSPIVMLSTTEIDYGKLSGGNRGRVVRTFDITNRGKTPLTIYSVTSDDEAITISGGRKEIRPNATATFRVAIQARNLNVGLLDSSINIVCNAPNTPVSIIKVTAEKEL
jgi:Protein of unknown function (DUF1573).